MTKPKFPRRPFDLVACERVMAGRYELLTPQEKRYVVDVMTRQGDSLTDISVVLQVEKRTVERIRATEDPDQRATSDDTVLWPGGKRDELAEWVGQESGRMICDVRDLDPRDVWVRLAHYSRIELQALVIGLAAHVPDDQPAQVLTAWCDGLTDQAMAS